jgi:glycosyltransferase involved in cell wall biosynthesis
MGTSGNECRSEVVVTVRVALISHLYANPTNRAKLKALAALGVDLTAIVPEHWRSPDGTVQNTTAGNDNGVQVVTVPVRSYPGKPGNLLWNPKELRRTLADLHPELVHIEEGIGSQPAGLALRAARRLGTPAVLMTSESLPASDGLRARLRRDRNLRLATAVVGTNSLAVKLATKRRPSVRHAVVPQLGITPPTTMPRERRAELAIGFVGRLVPERGLDLLFRACVSLAGKWTLSVVGTGPSQEELEELAQRLGIAARISWLGALPRQAVDEVWTRLDCLVLPSRTTERWVMTEARAAIHAMANGVAVIGTNSGALPEIIGDAGRIVPEEDVASMTAALQELYADRSLCERLGSAGRRRVQDEFSEPAVAGKLLTFWRTLTAASG